MIECGMISKHKAMLNMIYIWGFVNTPIKAKKLLYEKVLRKQ